MAAARLVCTSSHKGNRGFYDSHHNLPITSTVDIHPSIPATCPLPSRCPRAYTNKEPTQGINTRQYILGPRNDVTLPPILLRNLTKTPHYSRLSRNSNYVPPTWSTSPSPPHNIPPSPTTPYVRHRTSPPPPHPLRRFRTSAATEHQSLNLRTIPQSTPAVAPCPMAIYP